MQLYYFADSINLSKKIPEKDCIQKARRSFLRLASGCQRSWFSMKEEPTLRIKSGANDVMRRCKVRLLCPQCWLFEVHGSKLEPDPVSNSIKPSK